jgi:paraquat-inducible protein B
MTEAAVRHRRRIPKIWWVPIATLVLGVWMVIYTIQQRGPEITITFNTAESIEASKTQIKVRSVVVGLVETVTLGGDRDSVMVTARIDKSAEDLLHEDSEFWVVRPRIGSGGVSGLGTLLSGGYIQLSPGASGKTSETFVGLEDPPVTPAGTPGLPLILESDEAGSVSSGNPVLYKGFRVGRVETTKFDVETERMQYRVFIDAPYDELLTDKSRFWNASGISVSTSTKGIDVEVGSLETLIVGGIEFGLPDGMEPGRPVDPESHFLLYSSRAKMEERPYRQAIEYVVLADQSVRGLDPGAPVDFRGIQVGEVVRVLVRERMTQLTGTDQPIPILIRLEPGRVELPDTKAGAEDLQESIGKAVQNGLRATLSTGNLLTGAQYVSVDFYPRATPAKQTQFAGRPTIPAIASGLQGIEEKITALLDKVNALPLNQTVAEVNTALADLNVILASDGMRALPASLDSTLAELRGVLASVSGSSEMQQDLQTTLEELDQTLATVRAFVAELSDQPNALIFNRAPAKDPRPPAGKP